MLRESSGAISTDGSLPSVRSRRPRSSDEEEEGEQLRRQRPANWRRLWDLRSIVPPISRAADECYIFDALEGWNYLQSGNLGIVMRAHYRGQPSRVVAVKFQSVDEREEARGPRYYLQPEDIDRATDNVPENRLVLNQGIERLPIVQMPAYMLEIRSWALAYNTLNPKRDAKWQGNIAGIHDWARCDMKRSEVRARFQRTASVADRDEIAAKIEGIFQKLEQKIREQDDYAEQAARRANRPWRRPLRAPLETMQVLAIVMEFVEGRTVDSIMRPLSENNFYESEIFSNQEYFISIWTQLACTVAYMHKRVGLQHGDMHMGNLMLIDLAKDPKHPLYNKSLRYDLPVVDQLGRVSAWQFFTPPTRFLVKIVDFGLSKTRATYAEDLNLVGGTGETYSYEVPHFYLYRQDLHTAALVLMLYWARQLRHYDWQARGDLGRMRERINSQMPMLAMMLHALGRNGLAPYAHPAPRRELAALVTVAYKSLDSRQPSSYRSWPDYIAHRCHALYEEQITCIKTKQRDRGSGIPATCPTMQPAPLIHGETSAGPWSIDEHLVTFAHELGGFPVGTNRRPASYLRAPWLTEHRITEAHVAMLPSPSEWPKEFYPGARQQFEQQKTARPVTYPRFRGDSYGVVEYGSRNWESLELDAYVDRYRTEQRSHDKLYVNL